MKLILLHRAIFLRFFFCFLFLVRCFFIELCFSIWYMLFVFHIDLLRFWYKEFDSLSVLTVTTIHASNHVRLLCFWNFRFPINANLQSYNHSINSLLIWSFFSVHSFLLNANCYCILSITQVANRSIHILDCDSHPYISSLTQIPFATMKRFNLYLSFSTFRIVQFFFLFFEKQACMKCILIYRLLNF